MSDPSGQPLVLLVDDTLANLRVLFDLLSNRGFEVSVAEDGESALEQLEYIHPDLILLDVLMPVMDGYATCRRLKERPETRDIPVVFMTALTDTADKVKGFECGAVDYITKPFQHEEVLARIRTHIALQRLKQRIAESEERLASVIQSALDAIIAFDADGRITLFNRAAERVFRCPATAAIGTPCAERLSPDLWRLVSEYVARAPPAPIRIRRPSRAACRRQRLSDRGQPILCARHRRRHLYPVPTRHRGAPARRVRVPAIGGAHPLSPVTARGRRRRC